MKPHTQPCSRTVSIYATGEHPCAYLTERRARTLFVDPHQPMSGSIYNTLVEQGFRRSGEYVYRPGCNGCAACKSLRIPVRDFVPARRHRRCLASNAGVHVEAVPCAYNEAHFELDQRYIAGRHSGSQMADPSARQYMEFLTASWCRSVFFEFREGDRLLAVSAVDVLASGLSAVYTFFEPTLAGRGLGTLAILWLIAETRRLGLNHLYLGYWIEESAKMRYKSDFKPHEIYEGTEWLRKS